MDSEAKSHQEAQGYGKLKILQTMPREGKKQQSRDRADEENIDFLQVALHASLGFQKIR